MPNGFCAKCGQRQWVDTQSFIDSRHTKLRMTDGAHDEWLEMPPPPPAPRFTRFQRFASVVMQCACGCGHPMEPGRSDRIYRRECAERLGPAIHSRGPAKGRG